MNDFLLPMLAVAGEPFDSPEYLFEVKWNGVRALAARDTSGWCLWGRDRADYTARYPELECLRHLPEGTILDGEETVQQCGQRIFELMLKTASGQPTKSESFDFGGAEFAPWVLGATM